MFPPPRISRLTFSGSELLRSIYICWMCTCLVGCVRSSVRVREYAREQEHEIWRMTCARLPCRQNKIRCGFCRQLLNYANILRRRKYWTRLFCTMFFMNILLWMFAAFVWSVTLYKRMVRICVAADRFSLWIPMNELIRFRFIVLPMHWRTWKSTMNWIWKRCPGITRRMLHAILNPKCLYGFTFNGVLEKDENTLQFVTSTDKLFS